MLFIYCFHQPGPGRMITMMQAIQKECDRQARKIIEHFKKHRDFDRRVCGVIYILIANSGTNDTFPAHLQL